VVFWPKREILGFECYYCGREFYFLNIDNGFRLLEEDNNTIITKSSDICLRCLANIELIYV
jgi:hypothetical protein